MQKRKERSESALDTENLATYRRILLYIAMRGGGRDCIGRALAIGETNPMEDSDFSPDLKFAVSQAIERTLRALPSGTESGQSALLQIQREVLAKTAADPLMAELAMAEVTYFSLSPPEQKAVKQAAISFGEHFKGSQICIFDAYVENSAVVPRRRDMAVIWDGFHGITWPERRAEIKRVFVYPRFSVIGITPEEVDKNLVLGISVPVRAARSINASRVAEIAAALGSDPSEGD